MNDEIKAVEETKTVAPINIDRFLGDLGEALAGHNKRARQLLTKLGDPLDKNKPSKQTIFKTFSALYDLFITASQMQSITSGHSQALSRSFSYQVRSIARLLVDKGLITMDELKETTKKIAEEDEQALEARQKDKLDDAVAQAKEEASKRVETEVGASS